MQFLELIWYIYLDGYAFDHWVSVVWMVAINLAILQVPLIKWMDWRDWKNIERRVHLERRMKF